MSPLKVCVKAWLEIWVCIHLSTPGKLREEGEKGDHGAELVENGESFDNEWDTVEEEEGSPKVSNPKVYFFMH